MKILREEPKTVTLSGVDMFCAELLRQVVPSATLDDPAVQARLFSSPSAGREKDFDEDWAEYVQPDLRDLFATALELVQSDLQSLGPDPNQDGLRLVIPVSHLEAWVHGLNQARLALVAAYSFNEEELENALISNGNRRAIALFQVQFYGFVMECFLRELETTS